MSEEQLWSVPDDVESIYIHYTTEGLLKGFREEALRHREQLSKALELINQLKDRYKDKRIYVSRKFLNELEKELKEE